MSGEAIRLHLLISGRVQGVWFRGSMQEEAQRLGVSGWVKNKADGRVEAAVEGPRSAVEALVRWCEKGPTHAHVATVRRNEETPQGGEGFKILY
jgi:acylphosphatase